MTEEEVMAVGKKDLDFVAMSSIEKVPVPVLSFPMSDRQDNTMTEEEVMAVGKKDLDFVAMSSIEKVPKEQDLRCTDWVATEKIHGSSFQLYTQDGRHVHLGSRRRNIDHQSHFLKCNLEDLLKDYRALASDLWDIVQSRDRWAPFRQTYVDTVDYDKSDDDDNDAGDVNTPDTADSDTETSSRGENKFCEKCQIRIYGELYGGGGVNKEVKPAVQKEIIYCDEFRFYVYGITINRKWLTISELNDLCVEAGFPYYARAVNHQPKATVDELKQWLVNTGFMATKSAFTDKTDDQQTHIEGVVMTPLTKPDFKLHAIKFLAPAFNDVRQAQVGKKVTANYCTKQRYNSVMSKLDTRERHDTGLVVELFTQDIIKECPNKHPGMTLTNNWKKIVLGWLEEDDYYNSKALEGDREDGSYCGTAVVGGAWNTRLGGVISVNQVDGALSNVHGAMEETDGVTEYPGIVVERTKSKGEEESTRRFFTKLLLFMGVNMLLVFFSWYYQVAENIFSEDDEIIWNPWFW